MKGASGRKPPRPNRLDTGTIARPVATILLLLPSATYRATDFITAARTLGLEVLVVSDVEQTMASTMIPPPLVVDFARPANAGSLIVDHVRDLGVEVASVVAVDEPGLSVAALVAQALGLPHNPPEAVAIAQNKRRMREAIAGSSVPQPSFRVVEPGDEVAAAARAVGLPCVVKPISLSGSRGVLRADTVDAAVAASERARSVLADQGGDPTEPLLVESYIDGAEVSVEALVVDGHCEVLATFDKPDPMSGPTFEETLLVTPSRLDPDVLRRVHEITADAVACLGIIAGPVHAELRVTADGDVRFLECAARSIGGLCGRTLRFGVGASLEEVILRHASGLPLRSLRREPTAAGVLMLPVGENGVLRGVFGQDDALAVPGIVGLELTIPDGSPVRPLPEGDRYLGFVFAHAETPEAVEAALRDAWARLRVVVEPGDSSPR